MRVLVSTFGGDDHEKVLQAMRSLPYDRLVLVGDESIEESEGLARVRKVEEMAGHEVEIELVLHGSFMGLVESVCEVIEKHSSDGRARGGATVIMNISGGSKLLGDAALFAAFRHGIETYHCDSRVTKLPVLKGANAKDMFTPAQSEFLCGIGVKGAYLDEIASRVHASSKQAAERVFRGLKKSGLVTAELRAGRVFVMLTESGAEVVRAVKAAAGR